MSCKSAVCRTCLATDIKMLDLRDTRLQDILEKLTDNKLHRGTSVTWMCYICVSQLQRCQRFLDMALRADQVLRQLDSVGIQLIPDSITALRATSSFLTTPVQCIYLPEEVVSVKVEPCDVKEDFEDIHLGVVKTEDPEDMAMSEDSYIPDDQDVYNQNWTHTETDDKNVPKDYGKVTTRDANKDTLKTHSNTQKYICDFCSYKCEDSLVFDRHVRKHTKPFHCKLCKKSFSEQSSLIKHEVSHSSKRPYQCDHCNKDFSHRTYLISHLRTHSPDKPFKCDICFKQFRQTGHLIVHNRSHFKTKQTPQKKHFCLVCGKGFTFGNVLNRHMKTHNNQRPYACDICCKTFARLDTLKTHILCHTGEKPFACTACERSFTTSGNMVKHIKTCHKT